MMAGFRLTTKVQVSGWRFLLRRVEHAIVRRDTRMFDDPVQFYGRAVSAGMVIAALVCVGAALLAYFKPLGTRGGERLLVDRATNQLFVVIPGSEQLRPVYNLTSARLVLGNAGSPSAVKSAELEQMTKGQPIGIPGAPYATPVAHAAESTWALCDTVIRPESVTPAVERSVIALPLTLDEAVAPMQAGQGMLVTYRDANWLVTADGRHAVDLADRAITSAVGIPVTAEAAPISEDLFNALPNAGPWQLPQVPAAGAPNTVGLPAELVIGSVLQTVTESEKQSFVVLPDGVAKINATTAAALRATNSFGLIAPPSVEASTVARIAERVYVSPLPDRPLQIRLREDAPTLCWAWRRTPGDQAPATAVIGGRHLPIPASAMNSGINQIGGGSTVYVNGGTYVRIQAPDPRYGESRYYIDPQGVRYGLPDEETSSILGLTTPLMAPWQVVSRLVEGPMLSRTAAMLEHDTLPADPDPRRVGDSLTGDSPATPGTLGTSGR